MDSVLKTDLIWEFPFNFHNFFPCFAFWFRNPFQLTTFLQLRKGGWINIFPCISTLESLKVVDFCSFGCHLLVIWSSLTLAGDLEAAYGRPNSITFNAALSVPWRKRGQASFRRTVDGSGIRRSPPGMMLKPVVNNGINYQPQLVSRLSSINSSDHGRNNSGWIECEFCRFRQFLYLKRCVPFFFWKQNVDLLEKWVEFPQILTLKPKLQERWYWFPWQPEKKRTSPCALLPLNGRMTF